MTAFDHFIGNVDNFIINPLIIFLFALAVLFFLYGVLEFLLGSEDEEKKTTGKSHMLWGVIGITIMIGVWTILGMVLNTFGLNSQVNIDSQGNSSINLPPPPQ